MAVYHLDLPPGVHARLWAAKLVTGTDIQDLIVAAIDAYLDADYAEQATGESRIKFNVSYRLLARLHGTAILLNRPWEALVRDALEAYVADMEDGDDDG